MLLPDSFDVSQKVMKNLFAFERLALEILFHQRSSFGFQQIFALGFANQFSQKLKIVANSSKVFSTLQLLQFLPKIRPFKRYTSKIPHLRTAVKGKLELLDDLRCP